HELAEELGLADGKAEGAEGVNGLICHWAVSKSSLMRRMKRLRIQLRKCLDSPIVRQMESLRRKIENISEKSKSSKEKPESVHG
ncbi:unnamed protein product, partial [Ilex paraguariensis]